MIGNRWGYRLLPIYNISVKMVTVHIMLDVNCNLKCVKHRRGKMIDVTRLDGKSITINSDLIETVEETPDTIITLTTGKKIIVKESRQNVKNLVKSFRRECFPVE